MADKIDAFHIRGPDGVVRGLDEHYGGMKDVEEDAYGAWLAIQNLWQGRDEAYQRGYAQAVEDAVKIAQMHEDHEGLDQDGTPYVSEEIHLFGASVAYEIKQEIRSLTPSIPTPVAPVTVQEAVRMLEALPENELRKIISGLANHTPNAVYYPKDFLSDLPGKQDEEGNEVGRPGQAGLFMASALADCVEPGQTVTIEISGVSHGNIDHGDWTIVATRALAEQEGE